MTDYEKAILNKLFSIENNLRELQPKIEELGYNFVYTKDKELIDGIEYLRQKIRFMAADVGSIRADLFNDWNKDKGD